MLCGNLQVEALRREAAKWQELEESKLFLETQVAQFQSAKQQEASRADTLAAQVIPAPCMFFLLPNAALADFTPDAHVIPTPRDAHRSRGVRALACPVLHCGEPLRMTIIPGIFCN